MNLNKLSLLTLFAVLGSACTAGAPDEGEPVASFSEAVSAGCNTYSGLMPSKASLAVAMAMELKRWEPLTDLTRVTVNGAQVVQLSSAGLSRCSAMGSSCANTKALLGLQDTSVSQVINQNTFNPTSYRQDLLSSFQRQIDRNNELKMNNPGAIPEAHTLIKVGGPTNLGTGACGPHWLFSPMKASGGNTGALVDGKCFPLCASASSDPDKDGWGWENNRSCVVVNSAPHARSTPCGAYTKPANLANNLYFFGHPNNAYLAFTVTNGDAAIDPIDGDNSAPTTTSGSCRTFELDRVYSPTTNLTGKCCVTISGQNGALAAVPKAPGYYGCKAGLIPTSYF